ncbi:glycosyl transferase [Flavobacterium cheongpyeongense]|jgi:glycosyltransferase involved in cell wall biosynthesis|uniref:Glycosyl transferase n=1 Tax=Flavobacterium cheongpyeongense TaxID=2212651 RepID=A0A2V4BSN7_9FLAO|nr:glycosyltransferase [Flavobacterium cheongpyeongense]PXY42025.1 glycosyl transferase [Flavobacterium cheongpyeongense]
MKFAIITHVVHKQKGNQYFGYAPYVREMNIWFKYTDEVIVVAPLENKDITAIDLDYNHKRIDFRVIPNFNFIGLKNIFLAVLKLPEIFLKIFWAMKNADHIHLRCPGNVGLIGCLVQVLFPNKIKTAKYAGNWDPKSKQPWSYRLQKYILNNTFLTRNMQVLVYGEWENQSKNIKPFFTATYSGLEKETIKKKGFDSGTHFVFVGSLVLGKNPLYAVKLIEKLIRKGNNVTLELYGEGSERENLENYIQENLLEKYVVLKGNQNQDVIKQTCKNSHFVILPSKSEGWPKAIAEGMFWGCVPVATKVSCVPFMLDYGKRGVLLDMDLKKDEQKIKVILSDCNSFFSKSKSASDWSQKYTTDVFEAEIKKLLVK